VIGRATSDLHLTERSAEWVFNALRELRADAEERGGPTILAGDILDQPETVHMPTYNRLRNELRHFPGTVYVIAGNHDQYQGSHNALVALESEHVIVISLPTITPHGLMVPYLPPDQFWKAIPAAPLATNIWWTHQGWKGAYLNNMAKDRDGLSPSKVTADLVITGHYHCPQNIGPIIYCGSPYQVSFAEEGQRKGWLRFSDDNPLPTRVLYRHVGAPNFHTIHWHPEMGAPSLPEEYQPGDRLRVKTTATRSEVKLASRQLKEAGLEGVPVIAQADAAARRVIDQGCSPVEAARQYVNRVLGGAADQPNPATMDEWATASALWD
jgi:DNA repair exonuclease SbcCD nuclease subunit